MELITKVLTSLFPDWEPPENKKDWNPCLCPAHAEERPSCVINYQVGAIKCFSCDFKGDTIAIIRRVKEVSYAEAVEYAKKVSDGCDETVLGVGRRKSGRKSASRSGNQSRRDRSVSARVRRKPRPWT